MSEKLADVLAERPYPGRGILLGSSTVVYFLTGRSAASQDRRLQIGDGRIDVVSGTSGSMDALRHYQAYSCESDWRCIGNGDQIPVIATDLAAGLTPSEAVSRHSFEPDPPLRTPRISLAWQRSADRFTFMVNSAAFNGMNHRAVHTFPRPVPGKGLLITTYAGPSAAEVFANGALIEIDVDAGSLVRQVWDSLSPELRVAAVELGLRTGAVEGVLMREPPDSLEDI